MEENKEPIKKTTTRKSAPKKTAPKEEVVENDLQAQMQQMMQMMAQQQQMFMSLMQQQMVQSQEEVEVKEPKKKSRVQKGNVEDRGMTKQGLRRKYKNTDIYVQSAFQGSVCYNGRHDTYEWNVKGEIVAMHIDDIIAMPDSYLHEPWLMLDDYENDEEVLEDIISALNLNHIYRSLFILTELEEDIENVNMEELEKIVKDNRARGGSLHMDVTAIVQDKINRGVLDSSSKIDKFEKILGRSFNK